MMAFTQNRHFSVEYKNNKIRTNENIFTCNIPTISKCNCYKFLDELCCILRNEGPSVHQFLDFVSNSYHYRWLKIFKWKITLVIKFVCSVIFFATYVSSLSIKIHSRAIISQILIRITLSQLDGERIDSLLTNCNSFGTLSRPSTMCFLDIQFTQVANNNKTSRGRSGGKVWFQGS